MAEIKIKGDISGSTTIKAPDSGSDEIIELSSALASKLDLAGGKILQIVRATDGTQRSTSSTSFVDASISVTITPEKNTSAIVLLWSALYDSGAAARQLQSAITDSSNNVISGAELGKLASIGDRALASIMLIAYSTPATTSATTYKGRFKSTSGTVTLQNSDQTGQMYAIEVSA